MRLAEFCVLSITAEPEFREFSATGRCYNFQQSILFPNRDAYKSAVSDGTIRSQLQRRLVELDPEVIIVSGWARPESYAAILWGRARKRGIVLMSESQESDARRSAIRETIKARVVRLCDSALVGGHTHADYIKKLGLEPGAIFLGYDAVDNEYFRINSDIARAHPSDERMPVKLPLKYVLASARFVKKKNLETLIYGFSLARVLGKFDEHLVIIGDGPERQRLEELVRELGLVGIVHLPGFQSYQTLPKYYDLASLFIHVSKSEQWGLVVNEAMASGCPVVVSSACGSASQLVSHGVNGLIVDPNDPKDIARSLWELLGNEERRQTMGRKSKNLIADWGTEQFAEGLYCAVESATNSKKRVINLVDRILLSFLLRYNFEAVA